MPYLPVDTAVVVEVGPLIDDTDFKSLEEAIAYDETNMDVDLLKKSAASLTKADLTLTSGGANDWTHKGSGVYEVEITAAQNDTLGTLRLVGLCDGVLPFESPVYTVVPEMVYNALVAGSDKLEIDVNQVGGSAVPHTSGKLHVLDDEGNTVANESKQDTIDTVVDSIKAVTDNLPNSGVLTDIDTGVNNIEAKLPSNYIMGSSVQTGKDDEIDAIKAKTDNLPADPADDSDIDAQLSTITTHLTDIKGGTFSGATDSLEAVRDRGDAAWTTTASGSEEWEFTLTEDGSGEPVADAYVWVTTDEAGEDPVVTSGYTDNFGKITFYLDAGTYYFWAEKSGWNFNNPYEQTVS
ncbi:MAG: hypothetical protein JRD68_09515 [Deltaproteobacteria bacterium]|nr:hypothetical protein [Deltaproteobacteria bacterium]